MAEAKKVKIEYNGQAVMIDEKLNAAIEQLALDKADGNRANAAFKAMELKIALIDSHLGNKANQAALNELKDGLQGMGITPVTGGKDGISATYKENSPAPAATIQPQIQPLSIAPAAAESATQPATEWEAVNPSINTPAALNAATPDFTADINAPVGVALRTKNAAYVISHEAGKGTVIYRFNETGETFLPVQQLSFSRGSAELRLADGHVITMPNQKQSAKIDGVEADVMTSQDLVIDARRAKYVAPTPPAEPTAPPPPATPAPAATVALPVADQPSIQMTPLPSMDDGPAPAAPQAEPIAAMGANQYKIHAPLRRFGQNPQGETEKMQKMLKDVGYGQLLGKHGPNKDGLDDKFGPDTQNTVRAFQQANGLTPTGVMDENTANKLMDAHKSMKPELYASASAQGPTAAPATHTPDMAYNYQTAPSPLSLTGLNQQSPESGSISALFSTQLLALGEEAPSLTGLTNDTNSPSVDMRRRPGMGMGGMA